MIITAEIPKFRYIAQDKNGSICFYTEEPTCDDRYNDLWYPEQLSNVCKKFTDPSIYSFKENLNWKESLVDLDKDGFVIINDILFKTHNGFRLRKPEDLKWIAQDQDGEIFLYSEKPYIINDDSKIWAYHKDVDCEFLSDGSENPNWKDAVFNIDETRVNIINGLLIKQN